MKGLGSHNLLQNKDFKQLSRTTVGVKGPFGFVYQGQHLLTGKTVALKYISDIVDTVKGQLDTLQNLDHANLTHCYGMTTLGLDTYLASEYCGGQSIGSYVEETGPLSFKTFMSVARQLLQAVDYLYNKNLYHGNIHPQNILITEDGDIKLADFATSRTGTRLNMDPHDDTVLAQALRYIPPEADTSSAFPGYSDMWSVGLTFFYLLTGEQPFAAEIRENHCNAREFRTKMVQNDLVLKSVRPDVHPSLSTLIQACVTHNITDRPLPATMLQNKPFGFQQQIRSSLPGSLEDPGEVDTSMRDQMTNNKSSTPTDSTEHFEDDVETVHMSDGMRLESFHEG
eukprot:TRINITY_DN17280_c0_g1_i1.p1 TRINITY_DN17280_c0_g1~~TRINITY_DN17280_c0_g1_i1.p1  ORF type:complete len:375 (+),score=28.65 TRINITY_DN17280_c0_g1_i1:107-1126(+)